MLHMSGRKHRNVAAKVEAEEQKALTATILHQKLAQELQKESSEKRKDADKRVVQSAWNTECSSPRYRLPEPPHDVPSSLAPAHQKPTSLRAIMEEQSGKKPHVPMPRFMPPPPQQAKLATQDSLPPLSLPPGSAPPLTSPPWEAAPFVAAYSPSGFNGGYSLGDFLTPQKASEIEEVDPAPQSLNQSPWSPPNLAGNSTSRSFRAIQEEERDFKSREDITFSGSQVSSSASSKWFISERRERAGSFTEIQRHEIEVRNERLLIEEQVRIEQQIQEELAAAKSKEAHAAKLPGRRKRRPSKKQQNTAAKQVVR